MTKCFVCGSTQPILTVVETTEKKRVYVHTEMCLSVFNSRERAKKKRDVDLKIAGINMWSVKWVEDRWGWSHSQDPPCQCPLHKKENEPVTVRYTESK